MIGQRGRRPIQGVDSDRITPGGAFARVTSPRKAQPTPDYLHPGTDPRGLVGFGFEWKDDPYKVGAYPSVAPKTKRRLMKGSCNMGSCGRCMGQTRPELAQMLSTLTTEQIATMMMELGSASYDEGHNRGLMWGGILGIGGYLLLKRIF